jgi:cell shape-determining protein MreD
MKSWFLHVLLTIVLVVLNTSHLHSVYAMGLSSVIGMVFLAYLAGYRSLVERFTISIFFGFLMDSFSGGPFGLYTSAYVWIQVIARWVVAFLHLDNPQTVRLLLISGIMVEKAILAFGLLMTGQGRILLPDMAFLVCVQIGWAVILGPFLFNLFRSVYGTVPISVSQ